MGKLIKLHLKVIKPKLTAKAMCVYKFTLDTGFYYYGATTDLGDRIYSHLKQYRNSTHSKLIMDALRKAKSIKFEFVKFVNDKKDLGKWELHYLMKNVGMPNCLNVVDYQTTTYIRNESLHKVALVDKESNILKVYLSLSEAAKENGLSMSTIFTNCRAKYPVSKTFFRRLNEYGGIITPAQPMRENVAAKKVVRQYDKKMNFIQEFKSVSEAGRHIGCDRKNISDILRGKSKTALNFIFREVDSKGKVIEPVYKGRPGKKNKVSNPFNKTPKKPIFKMDYDGNILETYRSLYMAMKNIPLDRRVLSRVLKHSGNYKGYIYKYA